MRFLLDTHSFLWAGFNPEKLSRHVRENIGHPQNDVFISVVTFWEVALKYSLGKIELSGIKPDDLPTLAGEMGFEVLEMGQEEAASFYSLPRLSHKDPFDRMIIWQAIRLKLTLISKDRSFKEYQKYGLKIQW